MQKRFHHNDFYDNKCNSKTEIGLIVFLTSFIIIYLDYLQILK